MASTLTNPAATAEQIANAAVELFNDSLTHSHVIESISCGVCRNRLEQLERIAILYAGSADMRFE